MPGSTGQCCLGGVGEAAAPQRADRGGAGPHQAGLGVAGKSFRALGVVGRERGRREAVDALTVDKGTHIWDLLTLGTALRDAGGTKGYTLTVPISGFANEAGAGSVVLWNRTEALQLFNAIKNDQPIPASLLPKS